MLKYGSVAQNVWEKTGTAEQKTTSWELHVFPPSSNGTRQKIDISGNLIQFDVKNSLATPDGNATFILNTNNEDGQELIELIPTMSLVIFRITDLNGSMITRFIGFAVNLIEVVSSQAVGKVSRFFQMDCVDLMYGLTNSEFFVPSITASEMGIVANGSIGTLTNSGGTSAQSLSNLVSSLNQYMSGFSVNGQPIRNFVQFIAESLNGNTNNMMSSVLSPPSSLIWMLLKFIIPFYFNPKFNLDIGVAGYQDLINVGLVKSSGFEYSSSYLNPQNGSWFNNMDTWFNRPYYEFFGDVRKLDEVIPNFTDDNLIDTSVNMTQNSVIFGEKPQSKDMTDNGQKGYLGGVSNYIPLDDSGSAYYIYFRHTPYSVTTWNQLPQTLIYAENVVNQTRVRSASNVFTYYQSISEYLLQSGGKNAGMLTNMALYFPAIIDPSKSLEYGIKPLTASPWVFDAKGAGTSTQVLEDLSTILWGWYNRNNLFYSGTVTTMGDPNIKIGQKVWIETWNMQAYVESVNDTGALSPSGAMAYTTTFTYSRGMTPTTQTLWEKDMGEVSSVVTTNGAPSQSDYVSSKSGGVGTL